MTRRSRHRTNRPIVAVTWDHHEMLAAVVRQTANHVALDKTFSVPLEDDHSPVTAAGKLAEQLEQNGLTTYHLLIGLPRSQVDVLTLELPPASATELPEMVRNDVSRKIPDLPEESPIDFWLPEAVRDGEPQTVEAAALRPETQEVVDAVCEQLKQKPAQIVVRSLAIASLFTRQITNLPQHSLLLNLLKSTADISVLSGGRMTFTRSVHLAIDADEQPDVAHLVDEIRRTLFVAPRQPTSIVDEDVDVQHVYMFANLDQNGQFVEQLADELELTVSLLDPLAGIELTDGSHPEPTHRYAALIGMIRDFVDETTTFDFANPKQPPAAPKTNRRIAVVTAAGLAAVAIVIGTLRHDVTLVTRQADALATDVVHNRELLKKLQAKTIVLDAVQQWERTEVDWLEELRRLSDHFPPPDQAVVQRITMAPSTGSRGIVSMSVRVQDPSIIAQLEQHLRDDTHQVSSQRISQSDPNQKFSTQFETSVIVTPSDTVTPESPPTQTSRR